MKSLIAIAAILFAHSPSFAGIKEGGGGGAYVCRDASGAVTQLYFLDTWEADNLSKFPINYTDAVSADQQFENALAWLSSFDRQLGSLIAYEWRGPKNIKAVMADIKAGMTIDPPDDADPHFGQAGCKLEGVMYYDGAHGELRVDRSLFSHLKTQTDIAAAYMHEALYKVLREHHGATDSKLTRQINGCLFSVDPAACLGVKPMKRPFTLEDMAAFHGYAPSDAKRINAFYCTDDGHSFWLFDNAAPIEWTVIVDKMDGKEVPYTLVGKMEAEILPVDWVTKLWSNYMLGRDPSPSDPDYAHFKNIEVTPGGLLQQLGNASAFLGAINFSKQMQGQIVAPVKDVKCTNINKPAPSKPVKKKH